MKKLILILFFILFLPSIVLAPIWPIKTRASQVRANISNFGVNISTSATSSQRVFDELNTVVVSSATYSHTSSTATYSLTSGTATYSVTSGTSAYSNDSDKLDGYHWSEISSVIVDTATYSVTSGTASYAPGDNLGNHTATQDIDASGYKITSSSLVVTNRVGIGTGSPNTAFHVKAGKPGVIGSDHAGQLIIQNPKNDVDAVAVITGYESDGSGDPDQQLWYLGSASSSNENITFLNRRDAALTLGTSGYARVTVLGNGNVGIGTATPNSKLEVNGLIQGTTIYATEAFKCPDGTVFVSTTAFGGGGVSTFLELTDTPASFDTGKYFRSWTSSGTWEAVAGGGWDGTTDLSITNGVKLKDGYLRIGDGGTVSKVDRDGDLYVERYLEARNIIYHYGSFFYPQTTNTGSWFLLVTRSTSDKFGFGVNYSLDQSILALSDECDRGLIICDIGSYYHNFDHPIQDNPTLFIHSVTDPDSDNTQWLSFAHDQTDANIEVGAGDLILNIAGGDLLPNTTNHNLGSSSNYWGTLHIATITYHSILDYQPDLSVSEDILRIQPSDKSSYPSFLYRKPVDTIKIKAIEKDKIPKDEEKIKYKKIKDLPIECIVKKYDVELSTFTEVTMFLDEITDEEIIEILPQKSEVEVTYVGNEGVSLEAIISLLIEHNKELEQRVKELESK